MKFLKYLLIIISSVVFISACQKELSFSVDENARGTLKEDSFGDCLPSLVNGIYREDSVLNSQNNFIDIQVNITNTGTFDIKSDTINGYSFRGTGTLGIAGINTVRLYGSGTPLVAGTDAFTITFDSSSCVVNVIVIGLSTGAAIFSLEGAPGTCAGAVVNGTYTAGTALVIDNTVVLTVNVGSPGTYSFGTVAVNGMLFSATGFFPNSGIQSVTLNGSGIPLVDGAFNLTANSGTSTCTFSITVAPSGGGAAAFTLNNTAGGCSGATYTGIYNAGVPLTSSNVAVINVTVTALGTYSIISNTDNGIMFTATGTFTSLGSQPVALTGAGTPVAGGTFNYTATAGTSNCIFSISVNSATTNLDYLPQTPFSNWSDRLVGGTATDTSYWQASPNTAIRGGLTYRIFEIKMGGVVVDTFYQRESTGRYYQFFDDNMGIFDSPVNRDGMLLDSSLAANASWTVDLGTNTWNGLPATGLIECLITEKGVTAVIAGITYTNIIKVQYTFNYDVGSGNMVYATEESWYAKGKGIVYDKFQDFPVTTTLERETTRTQIF